MNAAEIDIHVPDETERVICWRTSELIRAGFDTPHAVELAECPDVDLHVAVGLLERGCPPDVARRILL